MILSAKLFAQTDTVTGNGDPNYIPLWISTGGGGGGGGQEEDNTGTTSLLGRTNLYYTENSSGIGMLGIGTLSPWAPLHVIGEAIFGDDWERIVAGHWYNGNPNHEIGYLGFNMIQMSNATWISKGDGEYNGGAILYGTTDGNLHFSTITSTGGTQNGHTDSTVQHNVKMTITPTGRVGINTKTPGQALEVNGNFKAASIGIGTNPPDSTSAYKLYVEGGIKARSVKVTVSAFADYVFDKGYSLISIPDLETYINVNRHLPGLPSAQEVLGNEGFEIGQMQVKLLEKIEEQSLYIISLQKQIDELKSLILSGREDKR